MFLLFVDIFYNLFGIGILWWKDCVIDQHFHIHIMCNKFSAVLFSQVAEALIRCNHGKNYVEVTNNKNLHSACVCVCFLLGIEAVSELHERKWLWQRKVWLILSELSKLPRLLGELQPWTWWSETNFQFLQVP